MTELNTEELKLLKLVCKELTNQQIAEKMGKSLRMVEKVKTRLYTKTRKSSNVGLFKWAVVNGHYKFR